MWAVTGRVDKHGPWLRELGASEVLDRAEFAEPGKPLQKARLSGVVDTVGSSVLANALTQLRRCDDGVSHVLSDLDLDGSATAELTEILDKIHITQNDLDRIKEKTRIVDEEKERIEMLLASYQSRRYAIEFGIEWEQC